MAIPLVDLKANYRSIKAEVDASVGEVMDSCWFVGGPKVSSFEKNFAAYCEVGDCVGCNSGTDALFLAFKLLGIGPGDEVITQANTFVATCLGISNVGATVVLVDCDEEMRMDVSQLRSKVTPRTKAIVPVHLYGRCAEMDPILALAEEHGIFVVEDAAQAHGASYKGRKAGSMGHVGCFSFYPGKNLGAFGDGGALVTRDPEVAARARWWRSWGAAKKYHHEIKGGNSRLDAIQAAVLDVKLKHLDAWNTRRGELAARYRTLLGRLNSSLPPKEQWVLPRSDEGSPGHVGTRHVWHLFVVKVPGAGQRDALLEHLHGKDIGAGIHYPIPIAQLGAYKELAPCIPTIPTATSDGPRLLSLPLYPELTEAQQDRVVAACMAFYEDRVRDTGGAALPAIAVAPQQEQGEQKGDGEEAGGSAAAAAAAGGGGGGG